MTGADLVELEKELLTQVEVIKSNAREREEILSNQLSDSNEQLQKEIENRIKLLEKIENYEIQFNLIPTDFLVENESFDISSSDTPNMEENYNQIDRYFEGNKKQNKRINNNSNNNRNNKLSKINNNNINNDNNNNNSNSINDSLDNDKNLSFLNNTNEDLLENYVLEEERELNLESRQNQNIKDINGYNNNDNYDDNNNNNNNDNNDYNSNNNNNKITLENNNKLIIGNKLNQSNDFTIISEVCLLLEKKLEIMKNNQKKSTIRKSQENGEIVLTENLNFTEILTSALTDSLEKTKINFSDDKILFQTTLNMIKRFSNVLFSLSDSLQFQLSNKRFSESVNESILSLTRNNIRYDNTI
jgi:hypothetical protein